MFGHPHEIIAQYGYPGLFVLLMLGIVGLPLPDETLLTAAGFFVRQGELHVVATFVACLLGSVSGITLSFIIGRTLGYRAMHRWGPYLHITEERLAKFHRWYEKRGRWTLMLGYYLPGVRHVAAIAAGASELTWHSFALFAYSGAAVWVATFLTLGYLLGRGWEHHSVRVRGYLVLAVLAAAALGLLVVMLRRRGAAQPAAKSEPPLTS
jgi:membrane protein DedA with SNARE-associated domain